MLLKIQLVFEPESNKVRTRKGAKPELAIKGTMIVGVIESMPSLALLTALLTCVTSPVCF